MQATLIQSHSRNNLMLKLDRYFSSGNKATLGIVVSHLDINVKPAIKLLQSHGCQSFGAVRFNNLFPHYVTESNTRRCLVLLLNIPKTDFKVRTFSARNKSNFVLGLELAASAKITYQNPGLIVFGSGLSLNEENVIEGLYQAGITQIDNLFKNKNIGFHNAFSFDANELIEYGITALIYDADKHDLNLLPTIDPGENTNTKTIKRSNSITDSNYAINNYKLNLS